MATVKVCPAATAGKRPPLCPHPAASSSGRGAAFWWCSVSLLAALLCVQTGRCVYKFAQVPTYLSTDVVAQNDSEFPAVTLCPEDDGYKADVLQVISSNHR